MTKDVFFRLDHQTYLLQTGKPKDTAEPHEITLDITGAQLMSACDWKHELVHGQVSGKSGRERVNCTNSMAKIMGGFILTLKAGKCPDLLKEEYRTFIISCNIQQLSFKMGDGQMDVVFFLFFFPLEKE